MALQPRAVRPHCDHGCRQGDASALLCSHLWVTWRLRECSAETTILRRLRVVPVGRRTTSLIILRADVLFRATLYHQTVFCLFWALQLYNNQSITMVSKNAAFLASMAIFDILSILTSKFAVALNFRFYKLYSSWRAGGLARFWLRNVHVLSCISRI